MKPQPYLKILDHDLIVDLMVPQECPDVLQAVEGNTDIDRQGHVNGIHPEIQLHPNTHTHI